MRCKLCDAFWDWVWKKSDSWERRHSNERDLCWKDPNRELIERALTLDDTDPNAAFNLFLEAADAGSAWATERVGWCYWTGNGVAADPEKALEYYRRAICAGSWMATIGYARLLAE